MAETHALDAVSPRFALEVEPGEQDLAEIAAFDTSRMHAAGVACSDCHNTHSGALYSTGDALCLRCHEGGHYDAAKHSRHTGEDAPTCIDCHMPRGVTGARSHHLLPPGDPLAEWLGQPDACASCHADWTDEERAEAWAARRAMPRTPRDRDALAADDVEAWGKLALDASIAPSLRGIAAQRFAAQAEPKSLAPLLASDEALVRLGALRGLRGRDIASIASALSPLATDDLRAVRVELGRLVGTLDEARLASLFGEAAPDVEAAVEEATAAR
jgi:hypothetical protein